MLGNPWHLAEPRWSLQSDGMRATSVLIGQMGIQIGVALDQLSHQLSDADVAMWRGGQCHGSRSAPSSSTASGLAPALPSAHIQQLGSQLDLYNNILLYYNLILFKSYLIFYNNLNFNNNIIFIIIIILFNNLKFTI